MVTTETACRSSPGCSNGQIGEMGQAELRIQTGLTGRTEQAKQTGLTGRTGQAKRTGQKETNGTDGINRYRLAWKTD